MTEHTKLSDIPEKLKALNFGRQQATNIMNI